MSHIDPPSAGQAPSHGHDHDNLHNPDVAHEARDINVRALVSFAIGLFVVTVTIFFLMGALFRVLDDQARKNDPPVSPLAVPSVQMPTSTAGNPYFGQGPGPQLLTHEPSVLAKQRGMEQDILESYGWVDQKSAIARLPISEAKKLILQRGLPARAEETDPSLGTRRAAFGDSSSGRTIPTGKKPEEAGKEEAPAPAATHKGHGQ